MITYILQHEISLGVKFSNLGHDLINITSANMDLKLYVTSQYHIINHLHVMTYLFDLPNASNS